MADIHVVTAGLVIARTEDKSEVYLYRGAVLPSSVPAKERARLVEADLVQIQELPDLETVEDDDGEEKTVDEMTLEELRAYAEANGIDLQGATRKDDVLQTIKSAES